VLRRLRYRGTISRHCASRQGRIRLRRPRRLHLVSAGETTQQGQIGYLRTRGGAKKLAERARYVATADDLCCMGCDTSMVDAGAKVIGQGKDERVVGQDDGTAHYC
jgi:hypothetical protein